MQVSAIIKSLFFSHIDRGLLEGLHQTVLARGLEAGTFVSCCAMVVYSPLGKVIVDGSFIVPTGLFLYLETGIKTSTLV